MRALYPTSGGSPGSWLPGNTQDDGQHGHHQDTHSAPRPMGPNYPANGIFLLPRGDDPSAGYTKIEILCEDALEQGASQPGDQGSTKQKDESGIPAFVLRYDGDLAQWRVTPVSQSARRLLPEQRMMTEQEWAAFVDSLRNLQPPGLSMQTGVAL